MLINNQFEEYEVKHHYFKHLFFIKNYTISDLLIGAAKMARENSNSKSRVFTFSDFFRQMVERRILQVLGKGLAGSLLYYIQHEKNEEVIALLGHAVRCGSHLFCR